MATFALVLDVLNFTISNFYLIAIGKYWSVQLAHAGVSNLSVTSVTASESQLTQVGIIDSHWVIQIPS